MLADLQHDESEIRRSLILTNINATVKETLKETVVDEWLFGKQLEDKVKAAKTLETSSESLKPPGKLHQNGKKLQGPSSSI